MKNTLIPHAKFLIQNEIELQVKNGLNMGAGLHSRKTVVKIVDHIATEIKKEIFCKIMAKNLKVCIIIDEASTISSQSVLIIYLKVEDCNAPPAIFLDLVELEAQDAETIYTTMLNSIYNVGFDIMLCRRRRKSINGSKRRPTIKYKICCLMILSTRRLAAFWLMPFIFRVSGMTPLSSRLNEIFG